VPKVTNVNDQSLPRRGANDENTLLAMILVITNAMAALLVDMIGTQRLT
jgi:hypothetical protein